MSNLPEWAAGSVALASHGVTVGALFADQARRCGAHPAIEEGGCRLTYAALNGRVNRLARALAGLGLRRGDRVAILSENRTEYLEVQLAAAKLGAMVACQNWRQADAELAWCLDLCDARLLLASERFAAVPGRLGWSGPVRFFGEAYEAMLAAASDAEPPDAAEAEDGLVMLYTSGTTGRPKGAVISHRAVIARCAISRMDGSLFPETATICWAPFFHMAATDPALGMLVSGGTVIIQDGFDPDAIVETITRTEIGNLMLMPATIDRLIAALHRGGARPKPIRVIGSMADLVPRQQMVEITTLLQAPYRNTFGATETGPAPASRGVIPIGTVPERMSKVQSSLCRVRLTDEEDREVPDGEPGEMTLRSPALFSGYWRNPEANAADFRGGWFHMGDVFRRNADGTLDFVDRRKYLIKSGGENIYPAEIEQLLLASPRIHDAAVVRRPDARWGEVPVAFVVPAAGDVTAEEVIALCRGRIAGYKLPKAVRFIAAEALPRSTTGKIVRHELEAMLAADAPEGR
ncbi:class I adenylate-forming enzyme family protein [Roseomonas chloroacetimidivorans]|uniref:class I adenylate-forming enzyme family protein n=1 Tax=Roseomonas chloroacetimidivorans TaxID=1766656 RepID=UPI003C70EE4C